MSKRTKKIVADYERRIESILAMGRKRGLSIKEASELSSAMTRLLALGPKPYDAFKSNPARIQAFLDEERRPMKPTEIGDELAPLVTDGNPRVLRYAAVRAAEEGRIRHLGEHPVGHPDDYILVPMDWPEGECSVSPRLLEAEKSPRLSNSSNSSNSSPRS